MNKRLTWGEFKAEVEKASVKDEDEISYIDISTDIRDDIKVSRCEMDDDKFEFIAETKYR